MIDYNLHQEWIEGKGLDAVISKQLPLVGHGVVGVPFDEIDQAGVGSVQRTLEDCRCPLIQGHVGPGFAQLRLSTFWI